MTSPKSPVTAVVAGAGGRGMGYALFAQEHPDRLRIVGVAEPREWNRQYMIETYHLPLRRRLQRLARAGSPPRWRTR